MIFTYKLQARLGLGDQTSSNLDDYKMHAVEDRLASFANNDFVLTNPFNGMVFSIFFEKPFIAIGNHERRLSGFELLLKIFNLTARLVLESKLKISCSIERDTEWAHVSSKLYIHKEKSIDFLKDALKALKVN